MDTKENKGFENVMKCTKCGKELKLVSTSETKHDDKYWNAVRRKYVCEDCNLSFDTIERFEIIKPIIFIIKENYCEQFSEEKLRRTLNDVLIAELYPTLIEDIVDSWYLYALHNSNNVIEDDNGIGKLRVAYTINTLVEFVVRKLCDVGLKSYAFDFLCVHNKSLINGMQLPIKLIDELKLEAREEDCDDE